MKSNNKKKGLCALCLSSTLCGKAPSQIFTWVLKNLEYNSNVTWTNSNPCVSYCQAWSNTINETDSVWQLLPVVPCRVSGDGACRRLEYLLQEPKLDKLNTFWVFMTTEVFNRFHVLGFIQNLLNNEKKGEKSSSPLKISYRLIFSSFYRNISWNLTHRQWGSPWTRKRVV